MRVAVVVVVESPVLDGDDPAATARGFVLGALAASGLDVEHVGPVSIEHALQVALEAGLWRPREAPESLSERFPDVAAWIETQLQPEPIALDLAPEGWPAPDDDSFAARRARARALRDEQRDVEQHTRSLVEGRDVPRGTSQRAAH